MQDQNVQNQNVQNQFTQTKTMHEKINAFGKEILEGETVRVAFDQNMRLLTEPTGAAFILEISLQGGHVVLQQTNSSTESGLVLSGIRGPISAVEKGKSLDLSVLLRFDPGDISHPDRPGFLSFQHRQYLPNHEVVLELHWNAGELA